MSYKVTAADIGAVQLNETDTVRSVLQNIAIILSTRQGTCPLYRGFGLPQKFVDKPMPVAMPMMYSEVKEAVEEYEPRADVVANSPSDGAVDLYVLMDDGTIATTEIKNAVLAACNDDTVRPLTDKVSVKDPQKVSYNITFTYYVPKDSSLSSTEIKAAVDKAVAEFVAWQCGKLGRDINPSVLIGKLMQTGIKRVALTSPVFTTLRDGSDDTTPQVAAVGTITATNGGYEDE